MIPSDVVERIYLEVALGKAPARTDTVEEAEARETIKRQCDEIRARGSSLEIPSEIPEL